MMTNELPDPIILGFILIHSVLATLTLRIAGFLGDPFLFILAGVYIFLVIIMMLMEIKEE